MILDNFCKDTRIIKNGDIYVGIKGESFDGNNFYADAFDKGAKACILDNTTLVDTDRYGDKTIILVDNTLECIGKLAKYKRSLLNIPVVAITGSVGKTSTKDMVASVLSTKYKVLKTEGNNNNNIGLPFTILRYKDEDVMVIGYKGYQGDAAWTYAVGEISDDKKYLMEHTEKALYEGVKQVKPGNRIGDISNAVEEYANKHHLGVVKELCGHGIGREMHEDPEVPNYGTKGTGPKLREGMVICIEPMLNLGTADIYMLDDEWTIKTDDGKPAAHYEHTILVTKDGYEILTPRLDK